jgi:MoaA/NifB/PqqE/SkfB family radical SAM enzyme
MQRIFKKALLKVGYACNNNCAFCHSAPHRGYDSTIEEIRDKIVSARRLGAEMLVLSGGEPTIRRDLPAITAAIRDCGMKIGLVTNGRMLAYPRLAEKLISAGLGYAYVSLCGPDIEVHDRHTRTRSFNQTLQGIKNLSGNIDDLTINLVLTAWNLEHLGRLPNRLTPLTTTGAPLTGTVRVKLSMLEPEGSALDTFDSLVPPLAKAAEAAADACRKMALVKGIQPLLDGFPLCLVPGELRELESGLREDGYFIMSEAFEKNWHPIDDRNRSFGDRCRTCSLRRRCRGVYRQYLIQRGEDELCPQSGPVPNSFNFEPVDQPEPLHLENCPIRAGEKPPPDPVRGILVSAGPDRFQACLAPTRDFSDATIAYSIRELSQVYRSRSSDRPVEDIGSDLERLSLSSSCRRCPKKPLCGGAWQPTGEENSFDRFNDRLAGVLSTLCGSVLDIGCGRAPYLTALAEGLSRGTVQYLGIDPQEGPERLPEGAGFIRSTLSDFDHTGLPFDNVLACRSLDHLASPQKGIHKIAALTTPGGKVLLSEDDVFGVVRGRRALEIIQAGSGLPFEHLANLRLDEAMELCRRAGLRPVRWFSAAENGCSAWLLECRRLK